MKDRIIELVKAGKPDREIAAALGTSKNVVVGARRRAQLASNLDPNSGRSRARHESLETEKVRTLFDRMDALHAGMDAVLAECRAARERAAIAALKAAST